MMRVDLLVAVALLAASSVACERPTIPGEGTSVRSTELTPAANRAVGAYGRSGATPWTENGPLPSEPVPGAPMPHEAKPSSADGGGIAL